MDSIDGAMHAWSSSRSTSPRIPTWQMIAVRRFHRSSARLHLRISRFISFGNAVRSGPTRSVAIAST